ncbi:MAG: DUF6677 family protein [Planctomycetota bacterium]
MNEHHPLIAWMLGWLFPGAGHWYQGRRAQGAVLAASIAGCFVAGALLGRGGAVSGTQLEYLVMQFGAGVPAIVAWLLSVEGTPDISVAVRETAVLYTVVPALLNVVVALDAAALAAGATPLYGSPDEASDTESTPDAPTEEETDDGATSADDGDRQE